MVVRLPEDPRVTAVVLVVVVVAMVASNLPLRGRPLGVRSTDDATIVRAHSWLVVPPAFTAALWWAGARHVPDDGAMLALLAVASAVLGVVTLLGWRNARAEFSTGRIVVRASFTGRRVGAAVRTRAGRPRRLGIARTGAVLRPSGLHLDPVLPAGGSGRTRAREFVAFIGLVRGDTWTYRALRQVARDGNWPHNTHLLVGSRPSGRQRRILDELETLGVTVVDRTDTTTDG